MLLLANPVRRMSRIFLFELKWSLVTHSVLFCIPFCHKLRNVSRYFQIMWGRGGGGVDTDPQGTSHELEQTTLDSDSKLRTTLSAGRTENKQPSGKLLPSIFRFFQMERHFRSKFIHRLKS